MKTQRKCEVEGKLDMGSEHREGLVHSRHRRLLSKLTPLKGDMTI
jgi:hypothetical protein